MNRILVLALASLMAAVAIPSRAAVKPSATACAPDAVKQARKLLVFHFGSEDDRMTIDDAAEPLPSIVNPANSKQRFDVLEVWGYIYKGQYRMRFEYYRSGETCLLMGQEILEHAKL